MRKIKLLMDFQGVETKNVFYLKDHEYEVEDSIADRLIKDKRAVAVVPPVMPHANPVNEPQFEEAEPEKPVFVKRGKR